MSIRLLSAKHAQCVLFHDTESFPAVKRAVIDLARESGKTFYFKESFGLGILGNQKLSKHTLVVVLENSEFTSSRTLYYQLLPQFPTDPRSALR